MRCGPPAGAARAMCAGATSPTAASSAHCTCCSWRRGPSARSTRRCAATSSCANSTPNGAPGSPDRAPDGPRLHVVRASNCMMLEVSVTSPLSADAASRGKAGPPRRVEGERRTPRPGDLRPGRRLAVQAGGGRIGPGRADPPPVPGPRHSGRGLRRRLGSGRPAGRAPALHHGPHRRARGPRLCRPSPGGHGPAAGGTATDAGGNQHAGPGRRRRGRVPDRHRRPPAGQGGGDGPALARAVGTGDGRVPPGPTPGRRHVRRAAAPTRRRAQR